MVTLRQAVLCERIRMHARLERFRPGSPPTTEAYLQATEDNLGFRLPDMLRILYLEIANGWTGILTPGMPFTAARPPRQDRYPQDELHAQLREMQLGEAESEMELFCVHSDWRPPAKLVEELRKHPGSYMRWDEDNVPDGWPDGFVKLAMVDGTMFILDGPTGQLYLESDGDDWSDVSFHAPSMEDWLERRLDATRAVDARYYPHESLAAVLEAEGRGLADLVASSWDEPVTVMDPAERRRETDRLRAENLSTEGVDPVEHFARKRLTFSSPMTIPITHDAWGLQQVRHQMLQQLYSFIHFLGGGDEIQRATVADWKQELERLHPVLESAGELVAFMKHAESG